MDKLPPLGEFSVGWYYVDADEDGCGAPGIGTPSCSARRGWSTVDCDCDDTDPAVHDLAPETAGDGVDSNCDGRDDL